MKIHPKGEVTDASFSMTIYRLDQVVKKGTQALATEVSPLYRLRFGSHKKRTAHWHKHGTGIKLIRKSDQRYG